MAIHTERLTKHYGDVQALVNLDLDVRLGEVFGFLGPNGSGKTTMIRTILDEIRPTSGRASILGMDTHTQSVEIRNHIGYVPGDLSMYPNLTGRDMLMYFANLRGGVNWSYVDTLADRLNADLSKKIADLSSGNRQKVGLIQAFMNEPELLIMDEPSAGLDPLVQREFQRMLREVASEGRSVFLSSHTLSEVQRVADRVGVIRRGTLVAVEGVADLRSKAIRTVSLVFDEPIEPSVFSGIPGVRDITAENNHVTISFHGQIASLLNMVSDHNLLDVATHEADLEDIFLTYYEDAGG